MAGHLHLLRCKCPHTIENLTDPDLETLPGASSLRSCTSIRSLFSLTDCISVGVDRMQHPYTF